MRKRWGLVRGGLMGAMMRPYIKSFLEWGANKRIFPKPERLQRFVFWSALGLLIFTYGFASAYARFFPFQMFENAIKGMVLIAGLQEKWYKDYLDFVYYDVGEDPRSINFDLGNRVKNDVTIVNYFHDDKIYILNRGGNILHRYEPKFTEENKKFFFRIVQKETSYFDKGQFIYIQDVHIFPNGDALMMLNVAGKIWPLGVGFLKVDRNSNILWKSIEFRTHHEFEVARDGRIIGLASKQIQKAPKGLEKLPVPFMDNYIVILNKGGEVLDRISLFQALRNSPYSFYIDYQNILPFKPKGTNGDYLHANDVDIVTKAQANVFPYADEGDLLISMRDIHAVGVLDIKEKKFKWMKRGPWIGQHDPDILPNGNLMIFDNLGGNEEGGRSRIIEYNPRTEQVVWSYSGTEEQPFESIVRGSQQPLPNGNVLISETTHGRVFEITRSGKVVWQLVSPFRFGDKKQYVPAVRWPKRIPLSYFTPNFRVYLEEAAKTARPLGVRETKHAEK